MAKIVFMGTPEFAVPSLKRLLQVHDVIAVVTQPDRPAGRNMRVRLSPVKRTALEADIPVFQPMRLRDPASVESMRQWEADLHVVVAFGQILPQAVLDLPKHGAINVHASLLPRWRGAAPIQAAIRAGDAESGVSIMLLDAGLDTGPVLAKQAAPLAGDETGASLHDRLAHIGAELLLDTLDPYLRGKISPEIQDDALATYAPQIRKTDGEIIWSQAAAAIDRQIRAFTPWPGAFTRWQGKQLKIIAGCPAAGKAPPGKVIAVDGAVGIGTGAGVYLPAELQAAGKRRLKIAEFVNGQGNFIGAQLGSQR